MTSEWFAFRVWPFGSFRPGVFVPALGGVRRTPGAAGAAALQDGAAWEGLRAQQFRLIPELVAAPQWQSTLQPALANVEEAAIADHRCTPLVGAWKGNAEQGGSGALGDLR